MLKDPQQNLPKVPWSDSMTNGSLEVIGTLPVKNKARKEIINPAKE